MLSWKDKVAVVTGAASGIGRELAIVLSEQGCRLALSDINEEGLAETKRLVEQAGGTVHTQKIDVAKRGEIEAWAVSIMEAYGQVDIVINNAGVTVVDSAEQISYDDFEWIVNINFWGVVYGCKTFLPYLRQSPDAYLVNISSIFGMISIPTQSAYNATKFAVRGYTESLRQELHDSTITVSCVHPGGIKTSISRNARHHLRPGLTQERETMIDQFENELTRTTPRRAAEVIVRGMQRKKKRILIGADARLIDWVVRTFPTGYEFFVRLGFKRSLR